MSRPARVLPGALAAMFLLLPTGAALSAQGRLYRGRTSQGEPIHFRISGAGVTRLRFTIEDRCPDGHTLFEDESGFGAGNLPIVGSRFGNDFAPKGARPGEHTRIAGVVSGATVTGSIASVRFSTRERRLCRGSATFSLRHG